MVARVDKALQTELGIADGLADPAVVVLDPCCGTGAYLVAALRLIYERVRANEGEIAAANAARTAIQTRIFGFELLPAPFVVAHLQIGLTLARWKAPLPREANRDGGGRARVYLTNALTDWGAPADHPKQQYLTGLEQERDAAASVKRGQKILVVIGNPPYNAFAGTSPKEEGDLIAPYKAELISKWGIKKFNLDELYVRFFRLAERCIAELNETRRGIVCYVSNFSYLDDPSFVVMRQRFTSEFDRMWFDCLNGDSRQTGKRIPAGLPNAGAPDPSAFSTDMSREGIRVGTAIALMVRKQGHQAGTEIRYRDFWGVSKRSDLLASLSVPDFDAQYRVSTATIANRFALRPQSVSDAYLTWPKLTDLCNESYQGLSEDRRKALIDPDRNKLEARMQTYFNKQTPFRTLKDQNEALTTNYVDFPAEQVRASVLSQSVFVQKDIRRYFVRPFDTQYCYYTPVRPVWRRHRPDFYEQVFEGNFFIATRLKGKSGDGAPTGYITGLCDYHYLQPNAAVIPVYLKQSTENTFFQLTNSHAEKINRRANLSPMARDYLTGLGISDVDSNPASAALIWLHALAVGYAPAYLSEHADGIRGDYPSAPLPASREGLAASAALGRTVADLLDGEKPVAGVTAGTVRAELARVAVLTVIEGGTANYAVTAGWGSSTSGAVMPGRGRSVVHEDGSLDVYLNDTTYWGAIPGAVWAYTIGGYQVLKKWLSYRESSVLGRAVTTDEAREFMWIARRIAALVGMAAALDANYRASTNG